MGPSEHPACAAASDAAGRIRQKHLEQGGIGVAHLIPGCRHREVVCACRVRYDCCCHRMNLRSSIEACVRMLFPYAGVLCFMSS